MARFPLNFIPSESYKAGRRRFGAPRRRGPRHGACDLATPAGTPVYALADGEVIRGPYEFYHGAFAIEVRHPNFDRRFPNFVIRYCEVGADAARRGTQVREGQVICRTTQMHNEAMLHLEMFDGTEEGRLTQRWRQPYQRRRDLVDPTPYLDALALKLRVTKVLEPFKPVGTMVAKAAESVADIFLPGDEGEAPETSEAF